MTRSPRSAARLAVAGLALAAMALTACAKTDESAESGTGTADSGDNSAKVETVSYQVPDPTKLIKLDNRAGQITVTAEPGPISIIETLRYNGDRPGTSHTVTGDVLNLVNTGCPNQPATNARCEVAWDIKAPAGTNLDLVGRAGAITVRNMAGTVSAKASAGAIRGRQLASKSVLADAGAGGVDLTFTQPPDVVNASSDAGSIDIRVPGNAKYAVDAKTNAGTADVTVPVDPASPRKVHAKTSAGSIDISTN